MSPTNHISSLSPIAILLLLSLALIFVPSIQSSPYVPFLFPSFTSCTIPYLLALPRSPPLFPSPSHPSSLISLHPSLPTSPIPFPNNLSPHTHYNPLPSPQNGYIAAVAASNIVQSEYIWRSVVSAGSFPALVTLLLSRLLLTGEILTPFLSFLSSFLYTVP
jgi:hypothetical protein